MKTCRPMLLALVVAFTAWAANTDNVSFVPVASATNLIQIAPDRADWTYPLGATPTFQVRLAVDPYPVDGIPITYRLGPEQFEGAEQAAVVPARGLSIPAGTRGEPGFTRLIVMAERDGVTNAGICTVGFSPDLTRPTQTEPADFDLFWAEQKAGLAKVPAEPELTPLPGLSTPAAGVFHWSIQNVGNWEGPSRIYGILAVPSGLMPTSA
jgi:cephalosporin-C deacetylase